MEVGIWCVGQINCDMGRDSALRPHISPLLLRLK